jgi:hypothetical protein
MHYDKITLRHDIITPSQAHTTLVQELYERQRHLNQSFVRQYALEMLKDAFRPGTLMSFAIWKRKRYLINGQHTHHAIVLAQKPYFLGIEEIYVNAYEDIAAWYIKFDRLHLRTLEQAYHAANLAERVQLNKAQTTQVGGCLPLMASGFEQVPKTQGSLRMYVTIPQMRMEFIHDWHEEAERYFSDIKGAPGTMGQNLRRAPVMAIALITYRYTGTDAEEFWHAVAMDDNLAQNDPRKRLHYHIRTTKMGEYLPHVYSRYVSRAWNAAWEGRKPQNITPDSTTMPIRIEGTPHSGEKTLRYITPSGEVLHDPEVYEQETWSKELFVS